MEILYDSTNIEIIYNFSYNYTYMCMYQKYFRFFVHLLCIFMKNFEYHLC